MTWLIERADCWRLPSDDAMSNVKLFESKQIRAIWSGDDQKWYFSFVDVVTALTDSQNPRDYWYRIEQREKISGMELSTISRQSADSSNSKRQMASCVKRTALTPKDCSASSSLFHRPEPNPLDAGLPSGLRAAGRNRKPGTGRRADTQAL